MKKLMLLILVLMASTMYSYRAHSADPSSPSTITLDADVGSLVGASVTGDFGWAVNIAGGLAYDWVTAEGATAFVNVNYPVELSKTTLFDSGTLFGTFGGGYRFLDGDDNDSEHILEAIFGLTHEAKNRWDLGAKTHLGAGDEGFEWAAYATIGYRFDI